VRGHALAQSEAPLLDSQLVTSTARAQDAGPDGGAPGAVGGRAEEELNPAKGLPGGGQLEAVNAKREMVEGTGHAQASNEGGLRAMRPNVFADWASQRLVGEA
jgi:hypothetical protein